MILFLLKSGYSLFAKQAGNTQPSECNLNETVGDSYLCNQNIQNFVAPSISRMAFNLTSGFLLFFFNIIFQHCLADFSQSTENRVTAAEKKLLNNVLNVKHFSKFSLHFSLISLHFPWTSFHTSHTTFKFLLNNFQFNIRIFSQTFYVINSTFFCKNFHLILVQFPWKF